MLYREMKRRVTLDKWSVHSYYTLNPYAPDGSGRLLFAAGDFETGTGKVYIADNDGKVVDSFGENKYSSSFFHTGFWQTWSPDCRFVYYQSGTNTVPYIVRRELSTGLETRVAGDMEGAPTDGGPIVSGFMGMLYAAGYGTLEYHPEDAPFPFQARNEHGLFQYDMDKGTRKLILSVNDVLNSHVHKNRLLETDREMKQIYGQNDGLTLMCYCLRWNRQGDRCLFYFGNHTVKNVRREPRIGYVFTANRDFTELHMAVDLSYNRPGVHWGWHPDGKHLLGYGPVPGDETKMCLAMVNYDGTGYTKISKVQTGGHPSISPADYNLIVTDSRKTPDGQGQLLFIDKRSDEIKKCFHIPCKNREAVPPGRNRHFICHHPVFNADGSKLLFNVMCGENSQLYELDMGSVEI